MNNSQLAFKLKHLASMMTLLEENPFKIRAFEKAARIVEDHPEEMGVLIDEDRIKTLPGIGDALAHIMLHYIKAGGAGFEAELSERLPEGLPELLSLPGLGLKKVHVLWHEHGITNCDQLHYACQNGTLSSLKGFGENLSRNLLSALEFRQSHAAHFHLDSALQVANRWVDQLSSAFPEFQVACTGDMRRRSELIPHVDLLVDIPMERISELHAVGEVVTTTTPTCYTIKDQSGLRINIWSTEPENYFLEQLMRTGGTAYQESVLSQLDRSQIIHPSPITSEQNACEYFGIQWIEPELRDLYATRPHQEELLKPEDIKGVFHAHSTWSDGRNTLEEMVEAVAARGFQYFGITEHSQAAYYANGLQADRVKAQWERIDALNEQVANLTIFKGIEADILKDGSLDYDEDLLAGFDFVIASIHSHFHLDPAQQTQRLIRALQSPFTTMLGHPTGRMLLAREGYAPDMVAVIEAAAENHKIIEINTTPKRLDLDWRYLKLVRELGVQVSINPDAHRVTSIDTIPLGVMMARKGGLTAANVVNTMDGAEMTQKLQEWRAR